MGIIGGSYVKERIVVAGRYDPHMELPTHPGGVDEATDLDQLLSAVVEAAPAEAAGPARALADALERELDQG